MSDVEVIVPVAFFAMIFGIIVLVTYYRNKRMERTALIASGRDASIFEEEEKKSKISSLKYGIFLIGIAIGFMVGDSLAMNGVMSEGVSYISMVLLFGGIALLGFYLLTRKKRKEITLGE
ncbi:DUF6249 domain-containing protein [Marinilabilia rubra]|uniref:DUF6249 domain-containing protein n=1 Tax=Marinilabilia rubra TaxID=2162893 RepID=A0A2U2B7P5_9BACT|nr:DUF6249 domain-containing protein [Marinilabilia rubra]PWD99064.1 hypothetical protein DDZ16_12440 [Marinilabilia rubra]